LNFRLTGEACCGSKKRFGHRAVARRQFRFPEALRQLVHQPTRAVRTRHPETPEIALFAPRRRFSPTLDHRSEAHPHASDRSSVLDTAFRYTAMIARLAARSHQAVSTFPAYTCKTRPGVLRDPFGFTSSHLTAPSGPAKLPLCASPVALPDSRTLRFAPCRRSPPGPLDPSGSQHPARAQPEKLTNLGYPTLPSLPAAAAITC